MLRSKLNPEEQGVEIGELTLYPTKWNQHRLLCGRCGEICYVDETTFHRAGRAILYGLDNPYHCPDCGEDKELWSYVE